jgi:uncharacterized protein YjeT (DUF2065 family)
VKVPSSSSEAQRYEYELIGVKSVPPPSGILSGPLMTVTDWKRVYEALGEFPKQGWRLMSLEVLKTGTVLLLWERDFVAADQSEVKRGPLGFQPLSND